MRHILTTPVFDVRAVRLAKRILAPATARPPAVALKATQTRVPARARLGKTVSLSRRLGLAVAGGVAGDETTVVDVGGVAGDETTVEVMPVPHPLLDGAF